MPTGRWRTPAQTLDRSMQQCLTKPVRGSEGQLVPVAVGDLAGKWILAPEHAHEVAVRSGGGAHVASEA